MMVSNRNLLFQGFIFRCYVSFREGTSIFKWQRMATLLVCFFHWKGLYNSTFWEFWKMVSEGLHPEEITRWPAEMDDISMLDFDACLKREASRQTWFLYKKFSPAWQIDSWKVHSKSPEKSLRFFQGPINCCFVWRFSVYVLRKQEDWAILQTRTKQIRLVKWYSIHIENDTSLDSLLSLLLHCKCLLMVCPY